MNEAKLLSRHLKISIRYSCLDIYLSIRYSYPALRGHEEGKWLGAPMSFLSCTATWKMNLQPSSFSPILHRAHNTKHSIACHCMPSNSYQIKLSIVTSYDTSTHPSTHPSVIDRIDLLRVQLTAYAHLNFKIHHSIAFG